MENIMKELVVEKFGLEWSGDRSQPFNVDVDGLPYYPEYSPYIITENGVIDSEGDSSEEVFELICTGKAEIVKLPFELDLHEIIKQYLDAVPFVSQTSGRVYSRRKKVFNSYSIDDMSAQETVGKFTVLQGDD